METLDQGFPNLSVLRTPKQLWLLAENTLCKTRTDPATKYIAKCIFLILLTIQCLLYLFSIRKLLTNMFSALYISINILNNKLLLCSFDFFCCCKTNLSILCSLATCLIKVHRSLKNKLPGLHRL